jgi:hypothetical protein
MTKAAVKERETTPLFGEVETPTKAKNPTSKPVPEKPAPDKPEKTDKKGSAVAVLKRAEMAKSDPTGMVGLVRELALNPDVPVEKWQAVLNMQMQILDRTAKAEFDNAMAEAKSKIPVINKNKRVNFTSAKGTTNYKHEDMAEIARTVDPILAENGLSYRYRSSIDGTTVAITCIVSHRLGHSEETTLCAGRDETGNKNNIQAVGSTVTYLQRYTLKLALGLAASDDDDGKASGKAADKEIDETLKIDAEQTAKLTAAGNFCGVGMKKFCEHYKIGKIEDLPVAQFNEAMKACQDYAVKKAEKDKK